MSKDSNKDLKTGCISFLITIGIFVLFFIECTSRIQGEY